MYFDEETEDLAWLELTKPLLLVIEVQEGIIERNFTDGDFKDVVKECPKKPSFYEQK